MQALDVVIIVGWVVFCIYWIAASVGVKAGRTGWARSAGARVAIVLIVFLLLQVLKVHALTDDPWLAGVGLAIFLLGLALAVWARVNLGRNWGTAMSQKVDPELVTTGPYHTIRHPIYSGIILAVIGTAVAVSFFWLIAVVLLGAYFLFSAVKEERYMTEFFPDAYPRYKQSTKMLIPFIF